MKHTALESNEASNKIEGGSEKSNQFTHLYTNSWPFPIFTSVRIPEALFRSEIETDRDDRDIAKFYARTRLL